MTRDWLVKKREERKMSQAEVAKQSGIVQQSYQLIEAGVNNPRPETAKRIGAVLGFPWWWLYADDTERAGDVVAGGEDPDAAGASADGADSGRIS